MRIPKHMVVPYCFIALIFVSFFYFMICIISTRNDPPPVRHYGCEKVYEVPPMWRCGEYGMQDRNKHIIYGDVWVTNEEYSVSGYDQ